MSKIISVSILKQNPIDVTISDGNVIEVTIDSVFTDGAKHDKYTGSYEVTPQTDDIVTLETKDKLLDNNITVYKIPYVQTTNLSDGLTVYIGSTNII